MWLIHVSAALLLPFWQTMLQDILMQSSSSSNMMLMVEGLEFKSVMKQMKKNDTEEDKPRQVFLDSEGFWVIDGTVQNVSDPIVVDRKPLPPYCNVKPFYIFTVCPKSQTNESSVCSEGIMFCYDGQMIESKVREHFVLPRTSGNEINVKCKEFNGFKIAMHRFPEMEKYADSGYMFMEVKTSFLKDSYYFPMPNPSRCLDLYLGDQMDILVRVKSQENKNEFVPPVEVITGRKKDGSDGRGSQIRAGIQYESPEKAEEAFNTLPDTKNNKRYADAPHLNMLYMDFRAGAFAPQMMLAIVPPQCNLLVKVRGNTIKSCNSAFKQKGFALRSLANEGTKTEYKLTIETGTEDWNKSGRKSGTAKGSSRSEETGGSTIDEDSSLSGLQRDSEHTERDSDTHTDSTSSGSKSTKGASVDAKANFNSGGASGEAALGAGASNEKSDSTTDMTQKFGSRTSMHSSSDTSITSSTSILENAYKNTQSSLDTQKKQKVNSQSVGVTKRTMYQWNVRVPPGKVLVPMQMTMDCDGAGVKIPWMRFDVLEEGEDLPNMDYDGSG